MDRISALRNMEEALAEFEDGDIDLETLERRTLAVLRTYVTEFEVDGLSAYRASGETRADGIVVVAESAGAARERVLDLVDEANLEFEVERVDSGG